MSGESGAPRLRGLTDYATPLLLGAMLTLLSIMFSKVDSIQEKQFVFGQRLATLEANSLLQAARRRGQ